MDYSSVPYEMVTEDALLLERKRRLPARTGKSKEFREHSHLARRLYHLTEHPLSLMKKHRATTRRLAPMRRMHM